MIQDMINSERIWIQLNRQTQTYSKHIQNQNGPRVKMGCCCLPPERLKLTANSKKETNGMVKIGQESKQAKSQNGPRIKMGWCHLPPERVRLTLNTKKETNIRVKMGQESKWAKGEDGLLLFAP